MYSALPRVANRVLFWVMSAPSKEALVCFRERKRKVVFSSTDPDGEVAALVAAAKETFAGILNAETELVVQLKNEDWAGEFVDVEGSVSIPDQCCEIGMFNFMQHSVL